jgi:hypothetical protein
MKVRSRACLAAGLAVLATAAPAAAAGPASVTLRVEGAQRTIYEGVVRTDARTITMPAGPDFGGATYPGGSHVCNGLNGGNAGGYPGPGATPTTALHDAATVAGFGWYGPYTSFDDFFVATIAGEGSLDGPYWEARTNFVSNQRGGCQIQVTDGDQVLYALDGYGKPALELTGPATARPGEPFAVTVTDAASGDRVAGASVGGQATGADGRVSVRFDRPGPQRLKAEKPGTVRSNGLDVCLTSGADGACGTAVPLPPPAPCVTDGDDGRCGSPDREPPVGRIAGLTEQQRIARRRAPRELRGFVDADPSGLRAVKLQLTRQVGRRCWLFSGRRERFLRRRCGKRYAFKIGEEASWSYLLPKRLGRGRYVLDVIATDRAGNRDTLARGRSRIVFHVR